MLWVKAFHIVAVVAWFAGIFYLPRLFVYHAMIDATDEAGHERFCTMERKLYRGIMTPSMIVTVGLGLWLLLKWWRDAFTTSGWLHAKLVLVLVLIAYHVWCGRTLRLFSHRKNARSHRFYRFVNEVPVLVLIAIVILVVVKPF